MAPSENPLRITVCVCVCVRVFPCVGVVTREVDSVSPSITEH